VVKAVVSVPAVVGNIKVRIAADVFANANSLGNSTLPPQPTLSSVTATTTSSNVVMRFSFTAVSGASYQVESTTNLSAVPIVWTAESGTLTPRAGVQNLSITNGPPIDPFKFFRLKAF
ncbi:MAG: hypothetical protein SFY81_14610, partial [Verrucomicrobiota bacterium]|nr:hypothetical protein [Verrucomicrobiota bacterium]